MIKIVGDTHPGRVRDHNEDAILIDIARGLAVVADGMGGHASGEVASQIIVETFAETGDGEVLADTLLNAHRRIVARAEADPESKGMGATVVAVQADGVHYDLSWVGDSRVYHWRPGNGLRQVSRDHSYLEWLLSQGEISEAEARNHPQRNVVTQGLGLNDPQPENSAEHWRRGDRVLLCSDGLSDELEDAQIDAILAASTDLDIAKAALIDAALKNGGRDNISVVLMENDAPAITGDITVQHVRMGNAESAAGAASLWTTLWPVLAGVLGALVIGIVWYVFFRD
jgi:PPM family protein phosphatase